MNTYTAVIKSKRKKVVLSGHITPLEAETHAYAQIEQNYEGYTLVDIFRENEYVYHPHQYRPAEMRELTHETKFGNPHG